jgi:multiple sugar transport system permease protein
MSGAKPKASKIILRIILYGLLIVLGLFFLTPILWLLSTALKTDEQLGLWPPVWIPSPLRWQNFVTAWTVGNFGLFAVNTVTITVLATFGQVLTASMAAFGFSRLRAPGRDTLFSILIATMMLPGVVTFIPTYVLMKTLGWLDTFKPLIVPAYFGGGAFFIFMLRQFFKTIPVELFESARIDGASDFRLYYQIMLPLCKPALSTVAIFAFMGHWNDFMGPLVYLNSPQKYTLALGLNYFRTLTGTRVQEQMAMSFMMTIPIFLAFALFQQYFIQGVVMTGIKA